MTITIDISIEEILAMRTTSVEQDYGYTVDQYDATLIDLNISEVYKGFKIYTTGDYYRWWKNNKFKSKTPLRETVETCRAEIDDYIIRQQA